MPEQYAYFEAREDDGRFEFRSGTVAIDRIEQLGQIRHGVRLYRRLPQGEMLVGRGMGGVVSGLMQDLHERLVRISAAPQRMRIRPQDGSHRYYGIVRGRVHEFDPLATRGTIVGVLGGVAGVWERVQPDPTAELVEIDGTAEVVGRIAAAIGPPPVAERVPVPTDTDASAAFRDELLAQGWLDSADVARRLGSAAENLAQMAARLRREGKLLGVWVAAENGYRHPPCQFDAGALRPEIAELLAILPPGNGSGWSRAFWLYLPQARLDGATPAAVLDTDPARVVAAARAEFGEDPDARW